MFAKVRKMPENTLDSLDNHSFLYVCRFFRHCRLVYLVNNHRVKVLVEEGLGTFELLTSVFLDLFEFVLPTHGLPLVYAEAMVGKYLYTLYLLVVTEGFAEGTYVLFHVAISGHEHITDPEGVVVLFEPGGGAQGLLIASSREVAMALGVELLDVEQHEVDLTHKLLDVLVPYAAIGVDAGVYAVALEVAH